MVTAMFDDVKLRRMPPLIPSAIPYSNTTTCNQVLPDNARLKNKKPMRTWAFV